MKKRMEHGAEGIAQAKIVSVSVSVPVPGKKFDE
jgi:hypothetical protein